MVVVCSAPVDTLPFNPSAPRPLMVTDVALAVVQLKVDEPPAVMESGLPLNMRICGGAAVDTVTTTCEVTWPAELLAVKV